MANSTSRPGLYIMVFLILMQTCSLPSRPASEADVRRIIREELGKNDES